MHLFICRTIFQVYYANIIIKSENIENVHLIYLTHKLSAREKYTLSDSGLSYQVIDGSNFLIRLYKQIRLIKSLHKLTSTEHLNLYVASIDDLYIHTIISKVPFESIYTFDDGTANYVPNSIYFVERKSKSSIRFKYFLMGNRLHSLNEIKMLSKQHFTTNKLSNIIANTKFLPVINENLQKVVTNRNKIINIYLCPNFDELYAKPYDTRHRFLISLKNTDIVIPHPRDNFIYKGDNEFKIENGTLAEKIIENYLYEGYSIHLFGMANSTQYHFININAITNHILCTGDIKDTYKDSINEQIRIFKLLSSARNTLINS